VSQTRSYNGGYNKINQDGAEPFFGVAFMAKHSFYNFVAKAETNNKH
jgi:hypothetical protein